MHLLLHLFYPSGLSRAITSAGNGSPQASQGWGGWKSSSESPSLQEELSVKKCGDMGAAGILPGAQTPSEVIYPTWDFRH